MTTDVTLTSLVLNPWDGTFATGDKIALSYADLDFTPSANDPFKSTSGDVFKVYIGGIRIYRSSDQQYASGSGFLEDGDVSGQTLNGQSAAWTDTSDNVWTIETANQRILLDVSEVAATSLYGSSGLNISITSGVIIELRRAVQDLKNTAVDFSNASILTEQDLDNSAKNVFHVAQQAVISTENAMLYDSGTDTYKATQPGTSTPKKISNVASGTATNDAVNFGQFTSHDATIIGYRDTTLGYKEDTEDYKLEAQDWATKENGVVNTYTDNVANSDGTEYSAKEYAVGTTVATGSSKDWATVTGVQVDSDYSAKEYAIGTTATSAKSYATTTGSAVTGSDYSAKEWALGDLTTTGGSAKAWAVDTSSPDGTTTKSAKTWAGEAATSAASADSVSTSNAIVMGIALG